MPCCHADFALIENSDKAFTVGMPTFTFGAGCLAEAGEHARELGLSRVALFTDARLRDSAHVAAVLASLKAAGIGATVYDEVVVEPTTASFQAAARFAAEAKFDGYVSVGGGSVMDTCKAANLYATHPADFMTYVNAPIGGGQRVPGYRTEPGVAPESRTETFVALKVSIDNWRWVGVPFYLRTGKRLPKRHTEITIQFKRTPFELFRNAPFHKLHTNQLVIQIQPAEGISLSFGAKIPGPVLRVGSVEMSFEYSKYFGADAYTGYEVLLYDCMIGDATLFQRADMVEAGWSVVDPMLDVWKALPPRRFPNYAAGSWGPKDADELLQRDERQWREIQA